MSICDVKRQLLADYMASLEHLKVAEQEHKEILIAGTGDGVVPRSALRIEAKKALSSAARARYADHCHSHRC
jgi:spermidine synthase